MRWPFISRKTYDQLAADYRDQQQLVTMLKIDKTALETKLTNLWDQNSKLEKAIHDMDQHIWNMSQQPNWDRQRPYFQKLLQGTNYRKENESERIGNIMTRELRGKYL